ncbi:hypothetical protein [Corynebacterium variabile]|uniref:hypothetical protein n=1 Tax=Corynebacterium variabile TaxID=1727 RepID=UPI003A8DC900
MTEPWTTRADVQDTVEPGDREPARDFAERSGEETVQVPVAGQVNQPDQHAVQELPVADSCSTDSPSFPVHDAEEVEGARSAEEERDAVDVDATPDPDQVLLDRLEEVLEDHRNRMALLLADRAELEHAVAEQAATIDTLRGRVEELTGDQVRALLLPPGSRLVDVLASLRDTARRDFSDLPKETVLRQHANELEHADAGVSDAVRALGLVPVLCEVGEKFSSRFHQATGTTDTSTADLDKRIARVIRPGFTFPGSPRPSIAPQVVVYKYIAPTEGE